MESKRIESMETWLVLKQLIVEKGYSLWQMQYSWNQPEGFIAGFMRGDKWLEVTTHNKEIEKDITDSRL
jgi:hypothetical protein